MQIIYKKEYDKLLQTYSSYERIFTDGSKTDSAVGLAAVYITESEKIDLRQRLPVDASISSAEVGALQEALTLIKESPNTHFLILSDSLSLVSKH